MFVRLRVFAIIAVILVASFAGSAWAEFKPKVSLDTSEVGTILINSRPAIRFQVGNGDLSPVKRAEITVSRLKQLVDAKVDPGTLFVKGDNAQARIYSGETMICVVTTADAKANRTSPANIAASWISNIKTLMNMPAITLSTKELTVPLGESRKVNIGGAAEGQITVSPEVAGVVKITADSNGDYVQISGLMVGDVNVNFSVEGEIVTLPVSIRKYAGSVSNMTTAQVTGNPCPVSVMRYVAQQAVKQSVKLESGANLEITDFKPNGKELASGQTRNAKVNVKISGVGYLTYTGSATVEIHNTAMPRSKVSQLFYSNDPERLLKYQTLFAGKIDGSGATRVLYHHQNMMGKRVHLVIDVINPNPTAATVRVIRGISDPMVDTVLVGHVAGNGFLRDLVGNVSTIEKIPPESRLVLVSDMLKHEQTASGILEITQMNGQATYLRVNALEPGVDEVANGDIAAAPSVMLLKLSEDVYPAPVKELDADYKVGERWAFIPLGKHALNDSKSQRKLYGNYGVTYNINVRVENPTSETKKVSVVFDPTAGLTSGVFIIDGKFILTKYAQPPSEYTLTSYSMKPGEIRNVKITTVPLAGSNYPATLVVRS